MSGVAPSVDAFNVSWVQFIEREMYSFQWRTSSWMFLNLCTTILLTTHFKKLLRLLLDNQVYNASVKKNLPLIRERRNN